MWKQFGPQAPRHLAALHPAKSLGPLPPTRCRAGPSLLMHVPDSPLRSPLREDGLNFHAPASKPPPTQPFVGKKLELSDYVGIPRCPPCRLLLRPSLTLRTRPRKRRRWRRELAALARRNPARFIANASQKALAKYIVGERLHPRRMNQELGPTADPGKMWQRLLRLMGRKTTKMRQFVVDIGKARPPLSCLRGPARGRNRGIEGATTVWGNE